MPNTLATLGVIAVISTGSLFGADVQLNTLEDKGNHFERVLVNDVENAGVSKVEMMKDEPKVVLSKWNDEVRLGVSYNKVNGKGKRALLSSRTEWKDSKGKEELHAYPIDDSTYEIEIVLNEKPLTNVFDFTIDGAENLDFSYQPALTQKEIDEGALRPENVVGSYAVYHKTKANHRVGSTNYATGKAFHIYRPKAIDANGVEMWAELNYVGGLLTVTVPRKFLDEAAYPVRVDPTFGSTIGGSSGSAQNGNTRGSHFTAPASANVTSVSVYCKFDGAVVSANKAIYDDVTGTPTNRLAITTDLGDCGNGSPAWSTGTLTYTTTEGTIYWFLAKDNVGGASIVHRFDAGASNEGVDCTGSIALDPITGCTLNANKYSIYATYTC